MFPTDNTKKVESTQEEKELGVTDGSEATYAKFNALYKNYHLNEPLGPLQADMPFTVQRTHKNNLPVYTEYKQGGNLQKTIIRNIVGDVSVFKSELSKVLSNTPITEKMGRVEINGLHTNKVKLWLTRLGF